MVNYLFIMYANWFCISEGTFWIDVCPTNANLLALAGRDSCIKIIDRRESKIVKTFDSIHSSKIV